jgi:hypothetical protein
MKSPCKLNGREYSACRRGHGLRNAVHSDIIFILTIDNVPELPREQDFLYSCIPSLYWCHNQFSYVSLEKQMSYGILRRLVW